MSGLAQPADPDDAASEEIRKLENLYKPSYESLAHGDPIMMMQNIMRDTNRRIEGLRRIARRHPTSALAHSELGSRLGWAGSKIFGDRSMIDEAIAECKIAAMLREGWDLPLVEPAIFLSNAGYHEEALQELEWAKSKLPEKTENPHFAYAYGYTQMVLGRFSEALDEFEFVLEHRPDYAMALNDAAHSAFMLGNKTKGRRYAKEARKYGYTQTYQNWKSGVYSKS